VDLFVLSHVHEFEDGHEDLKIIGIYQTRIAAESVLSWIRDQPGFRDNPEGFSIGEWTLDQTEWREGFTTALPDGSFSN
jgi:hypothetical protein